MTLWEEEIYPRGGTTERHKVQVSSGIQMHAEEYLWEQGETDVQATIPFFNQKDSAVVSLYISGLNTSGLLDRKSVV